MNVRGVDRKPSHAKACVDQVTAAWSGVGYALSLTGEYSRRRGKFKG